MKWGRRRSAHHWGHFDKCAAEDTAETDRQMNIHRHFDHLRIAHLINDRTACLQPKPEVEVEVAPANEPDWPRFVSRYIADYAFFVIA